MLGRAALAILFALFAGAWAIRSAIVEAKAESRPELAAKAWPGHPAVQASLGMIGVGEAAGRGQAPAAATLRRIDSIARLAPLAPEPLLVRGAMAAQRGDYRQAEALLENARARDPRSTAARYLLADIYLRSGRLDEGVTELSALTILVPGADRQLLPALEQYATSGGDIGQIRRLVSGKPGLERRLLTELAKDEANADLVLALAAGRRDFEGEWSSTLVESLLEKGLYARALKVWARLSAVPQASVGERLFNPDFSHSDAPPPFNWRLASGSGGVAEPSEGALRVLYYGRKDIALASQTMLLKPGAYRLQLNVSGKVPAGESIAWRLGCLDGERELMVLPLGGNGAAAADFTVPSGCEAQRLELVGKATDMAQSADFRISGLRLERLGR